MKNLSESLLDDFDTIAQRSDGAIYIQQFNETWNKNLRKPLCDWCGNKINIGDLVLHNRIGFVVPGIVMDIKNNKIAVSTSGNIEDLKILGGPYKGQIAPGAYIDPNMVMKITPQILKSMYNIK